MQAWRSLSVKQMTAVICIILATAGLFIVVQLFYLVQQYKADYIRQLEGIALLIQQPLSDAVSDADIPKAKHILQTLEPIKIISNIAIFLPGKKQSLHVNLQVERPIPVLIERIFHLPVKITVPLYTTKLILADASPLPLLALQADSFLVYSFIINIFYTLLTTYLLLMLFLFVAVNWCINHLIIDTSCATTFESDDIPQEKIINNKPPSIKDHHDDAEVNMLISGDNHSQHWQVDHLQRRDNKQNGLLKLPSTAKIKKQLIQEDDVLRAIEQLDFTLLLQPVWDMNDKSVIGAEALLRWRQSDGNFLAIDFVPLIEETGAIIPLGNWVLEQAFCILADWKIQGITLSLAINISGLQIQHECFLSHLKTLLSHHQINPRQLQL